MLFMMNLQSVLIENYQAPQELDDSLIGNVFKTLRGPFTLSIFSYAKHLTSHACGEQ
ncbi:hypothetical protein D3C75_1383490 [compost metagenome]